MNSMYLKCTIFVLFSFSAIIFSFQTRELTSKGIESIFDMLKTLKNTPYVWGGNNNLGIDC
ncbi:MAG: hypothetical protein ACK4MM_05465, partial [Fervidobacterium sp.]